MKTAAFFTRVLTRVVQLLLAFVVIAGVGVAVAASQSPHSSGGGAPPELEKSGIECAWLNQIKAHLHADFTCPTTLPELSASSSPSSDPIDQEVIPSSGGAPTLQFGPNVDATNPADDLASGQSETAIAASGQFVVSTWNDATAFLIPDATLPEGSLTDAGFSDDGGQTFQDQGGLPNNNGCQRIAGDPSVVSYPAPQGGVFFYITSLYLPDFGPTCTGTPHFEISLSVGTVSADGKTIAFDNPVVVADGGSIDSADSATLDKDFAAIDRNHAKIAVSYSSFRFTPAGTVNEIDVAYCDLSSPGTPVCTPGTGGVSAPSSSISAQVIATSNPAAFEELEGAYPAFDAGGNLYVAWNQNWVTNLFNGDPFTHELVARLPATCVATPPCSQPRALTVEPNVKSLDATTIPGYSRIANDFPRIAFNNTTNQLVIVWNEANAHPQGDIVLVTASPSLSTVSPKVRVNDDNSFAMHLFPAVSVDANGNINLSWYDRREAQGSTRTDVFATSIRPGFTGAPNSKITDVATDWLATGSVIDPNFGDYTDNTSDGTTFYVNWSDGRIGIPNSFVASAQSNTQN